MRSVYAVIPARSGSKGIPNKNLINFCGRPLLAWSILQAKHAKKVDRVYVSSDGDAILSEAERWGAIPIRRPLEISGDFASSESALLHAIDYWNQKENKEPNAVVFLQATSPLRRSHDIDCAIETFEQDTLDSLFSVSVMEDFCLWEQRIDGLFPLNYDPQNRGQRQKRRPVLLENGSIYVMKTKILKEFKNRIGGKFIPYEMPFWTSYELDEIKQLELMEWQFLSKNLNRCFREILLENISLIVYDFDGVMTNNKCFVSESGTESVVVNRSDGIGVKKISKSCIQQIILSTEKNPVVSARANKINLTAHQGVENKELWLREYCQSHGVDLGRVLYVGNDVNDLSAMKIVGYPVAPADAHPEIARIAIYQTKVQGGEGVIRELAENVLGLGGGDV